MKRREYRDRQTVTFSAERSRYHDFEELCDKEHKSISLKLGEMIEGELEKNALGNQPNAIGVSYIDTYVSNKKPPEPENMSLDQWVQKVKTIESLPELGKIKGYHTRIANVVQVRMNQIKQRTF